MTQAEPTKCKAEINLTVQGNRWEREADEVIRRLRARDPEAMTDIYDRYGRVVYSQIAAMVRNPSAAEDLAQEVFLTVWNRASSFSADRGSFGAWILAIARNRSIDYLRSRAGRACAAEVDLSDIFAPRVAEVEHRDMCIDRALRLNHAFAKLTPVQFNLIELAYYEGLSQVEIAARLDHPLGTIKTWMRSAMKALHTALSHDAIAA